MKKFIKIFLIFSALGIPIQFFAQEESKNNLPPAMKSKIPHSEDIVEELIVQSNQSETVEPNLKKTAENDTLVFTFGLKLNTIIKEKNTTEFINNFDLKTFRDRILNQIKELNDDNEEYAEILVDKGISNQKKQLDGFLKNLNDGYFDFVNYRFDVFQESYVLLFRKFNEEQGLNYIEFRLSKVGNELTFNDIYSYFQGIQFSTDLAEVIDYQLLSTSDDPNKIDVKSDIELFKKSKSAYSAGDYLKSYQYLDSLKGDMRYSKPVLNTKIFASLHLGPEKYQQALEEFESKYGNDPSACLSLVDFYSYQKDTKKVMSLFRILEKETGDGFLNYIKANYLFDIGEFEEATPFFKQVMYQFPSFPNAYFQYINLNLTTKNYEEVAKTFGYLLELGFNKEELIQSIENAKADSSLQEFSQSKAYLNWKKSKQKDKKKSK